MLRIDAPMRIGVLPHQGHELMVLYQKAGAA